MADDKGQKNKKENSVITIIVPRKDKAKWVRAAQGKLGPWIIKILNDEVKK